MLRRAVFSDYQRKGLEKRFQIQKYISKPDRKKLAEKLGLKDSQVSTYIFLNCFLFLTHCAKNPLMSHLKTQIKFDLFCGLSDSKTWKEKITLVTKSNLFIKFLFSIYFT